MSTEDKNEGHEGTALDLGLGGLFKGISSIVGSIIDLASGMTESVD